jgi:hypothetical protein
VRQGDVREGVRAARLHEPGRGRAETRSRRRLGQRALRFVGRHQIDERRKQIDEHRHQTRIERASGFGFEQRHRVLTRQRFVIRAVGRDRVVVVDNGENPRADRDRFSGQPLRIAFAVPSFVMTEDQRRDGVGEVHFRDDLRADLRMNPDLLEFLLRQRSGLGQDVFGHGELADVVQQCRGPHALDRRVGQPDRLRQLGRVRLHTADVHVRGLILGVDRAGKGLNRRQVEIRGLRDLAEMALLVFDPPEVDAVGAVGDVQRRVHQRQNPVAGMLDQRGGYRGRAGADEIARRAPQVIDPPRVQDRCVFRQRDLRRRESGIEQEVDARGADQPRANSFIGIDGAAPPARPIVSPAT